MVVVVREELSQGGNTELKLKDDKDSDTQKDRRALQIEGGDPPNEK